MIQKINTGIIAPDFELVDTSDNLIRLSSFRGKNYVVLVFNRGFA